VARPGLAWWRRRERAARGKAARRAAADEVAPGAEIVTREWDGRQARVVAR